MFSGIWGFDFKISIRQHIVNLEQGRQISVPVDLTLVRGKPKAVKFDVNTRWDSVGLTAQVHPPELVPRQPWAATMEIRASQTTPPDSYLFTVRGSTSGTFHTSEDAITVIVRPKDRKDKRPDEPDEYEDADDFFQSNKTARPVGSPLGGVAAGGSPGLNLDTMFAPSKKAPAPASAEAASKPSGSGAVSWVIAIILGFIIFAVIASKNGLFDNVPGGTVTGCPQLDCGGRGLGGTIPANCPCPSGCPYESNAGMKGYKQCSSFRPR
jgi:hypothetical protein